MRIFIFLLLLPGFAIGQATHKMSSIERQQMPDYIQQYSNQSTSGIPFPPSSPVRASAEWEEIDALTITWTTYPAILTEIVRAAQQETNVIIVCSDSNAVKTTLSNAGVPDTNLEFIIAPFNAIWCRDYGQWNVYTNEVDSLALIDWIYNRPRPKDDTVPSAIQHFTNIPMYETTTAPYDLIHTGGNFMCDGFGTGFSSKLILNENPTHTEAEIDTIMKQFMGINRYIKMNTLPYDQIHHIDMHIKLLDEETLLVGEYPQGIADGPQIEANLQYVLANFNSVFGTPYKVIRIPMPPDAMGLYPDNGGDYRTYTNSVFVNKTIILPTYSQQYDTTAIRIYKEAMPGYTVTGINCNSIIPSLGAIHCITKEVAAADPLLISHQQLPNTIDVVNSYPVVARIEHRSGIQTATLYYRTDTTQPWLSAPMTNTALYYWTGYIPPQIAGTTVYYYISAESVSGKSQKRPMPAPTGYFHFDVLMNIGIAETNNFKVEKVFPNPSHGITCIPVTTGNCHLIISLKNILGQAIETIYDGLSAGERKFFVNTIDLSSGVYLVEISTGENFMTQKLIVH
jgi:agmatine deiminase